METTKNLKIVRNAGEHRGHGEWLIIATAGPYEGRAVNSRDDHAEAVALMHDIEARYYGPQPAGRRNDPAAEALRIGRGYGVNGGIWDNA